MPLVAKVQVIPEHGAARQVAAPVPRDLSESDLESIATVVNQAITALRAQLTTSEAEPKTFGPREIELKFGIDLQGESKIPIIGPLLK